MAMADGNAQFDKGGKPANEASLRICFPWLRRSHVATTYSLTTHSNAESGEGSCDTLTTQPIQSTNPPSPAPLERSTK